MPFTRLRLREGREDVSQLELASGVRQVQLEVVPSSNAGVGMITRSRLGIPTVLFY
jgi:hypothetical protein